MLILNSQLKELIHLLSYRLYFNRLNAMVFKKVFKVKNLVFAYKAACRWY